MRDFVHTWYSSITQDDQCALYIRFLMTDAIGALASKTARVNLPMFLADDVCEAVRYHLKWYGEMLEVAQRKRAFAFRAESGTKTSHIFCYSHLNHGKIHPFAVIN